MKNQKTSILNMTEGNPVALIIQFSIPMLIGNLFQQLYNLVDSIIVGQFVGADALAAIGATGSVTFLFFALCNGIGSSGITAWMRYRYFKKRMAIDQSL
ncbi:MATE family efflux transporter [Butyrivibrio sp. TB]|uniref:MATE family efflux transporter n=1 Tax=Butyrivibrio sp. TB TaxID=1520809 RepID=UPI0008BFC162|nr:MATE family efflux transporter [Butyrivibrio sp. TB]SEP72145.1 MatE protein [Butyrivibrio sp. TB]